MLEAALHAVGEAHQGGEAQVDLGLERLVVAGFREGLAVERDGISNAVGDPREPAQDGCASSPWCGRDASLLEKARRPRAIARVVVPLGGKEEAATCVLCVHRRREPKRLLGELGRSYRRASRVRRLRRRFEGRGDLPIRLERREREVPTPFLGARDERCESSMQSASTGGRLTRGDRSRQERVGESQVVIVELEDSCLERLLESLLRFGEHALDERGGWVRDRGYDSGNVHRAPIEVGETLAQELVERGWQRERITGCRGVAAPLQRFGQLEREERIPGRRLPELEQRRPREGHLEPPLEELAQGADAYPDDLERRRPLGQAPPEPFGRVAPHRQKNC